MSKPLERDLETLERDVLLQSSVVEEMIRTASRALRDRRIDAVEEVREAELGVNDREVQIEDECLKILALHQPVAVDLRRVATVLKVNSDLERIADLAVNLAERSVALMEHPNFVLPTAIERMVAVAIEMVRESLDALVDLDADSARRVCERDDEVDDLNRKMIDSMATLMRNDSDAVVVALHALSAARHVERIADHATNIAEDVIYLVEGEIARHQHETSDSPNDSPNDNQEPTNPSTPSQSARSASVRPPQKTPRK